MNAKTIGFNSRDIVDGLTSVARIKFGYPEKKYAATNNKLANRALRILVGSPGGPFRHLRWMYKINLANVTYSYLIGYITDESFKEFLDDYDEKDKWFWCKNDNFNTLETKLLTA